MTLERDTKVSVFQVVLSFKGLRVKTLQTWSDFSEQAEVVIFCSNTNGVLELV